MHKLADYKDKKDAVAVSDKVYNDIEELKKATTPDRRQERVRSDCMI